MKTLNNNNNNDNNNNTNNNNPILNHPSTWTAATTLDSICQLNRDGIQFLTERRWTEGLNRFQEALDRFRHIMQNGRNENNGSFSSDQIPQRNATSNWMIRVQAISVPSNHAVLEITPSAADPNSRSVELYQKVFAIIPHQEHRAPYPTTRSATTTPLTVTAVEQEPSDNSGNRSDDDSPLIHGTARDLIPIILLYNTAYAMGCQDGMPQEVIGPNELHHQQEQQQLQAARDEALLANLRRSLHMYELAHSIMTSTSSWPRNPSTTTSNYNNATAEEPSANDVHMTLVKLALSNNLVYWYWHFQRYEQALQICQDHMMQNWRRLLDCLQQQSRRRRHHHHPQAQEQQRQQGQGQGQGQEVVAGIVTGQDDFCFFSHTIWIMMIMNDVDRFGLWAATTSPAA